MKKINLGCGGRTFPGEEWLNVDLGEGDGPVGVNYRQMDISKPLPFDDGTFDEVFSCHVIEHFWPWEIAGILREWVRILKKGGTFTVECPNIHGVAAMILEAEKLKHDTLWTEALKAVYGDPADKALPMRHKWGYSPRSLSGLLKIVGLHDIHQEPAHYKMKEPRDMRIVGYK